jgi:hypothetical protein
VTLAGLGRQQINASHAIADSEAARTRGVRAAGSALALLRDARAALAAGNLDVVAHFLDRATEYVEVVGHPVDACRCPDCAI